MNKWVFINQSTGTTQNGSKLDSAALAIIANIVEIQLNADYNPECGGLDAQIRVDDGSPIAADEKRFIYVDTLPDAPGASAYHVPGAAYCAIATCVDLYGPQGVSVDASHECLEDAGNPGCNMAVDDGNGQEHERERCDAIETQTYTINHSSGQVVSVSDFLLDSWQIPGGIGPFTFMTKNQFPGAKDPPGPFQTLPNDGGNYQIVFPSDAAQEQKVFARSIDARTHILGTPRKPGKMAHWTSRASRIAENRASKVKP